MIPVMAPQGMPADVVSSSIRDVTCTMGRRKASGWSVSALTPNVFHPRRYSFRKRSVTGTYFGVSVVPLVIANISTVCFGPNIAFTSPALTRSMYGARRS